MASLHPTIPGTLPGSNGSQPHPRRRLILTKNPSSPGKPTTTRSWTRLTETRPTARRSPLPDSSTATGLPVEEHNPALLHHFADEEQQRNSASLGMWVFLATEVMFFGGLFCAYLVYRLKYFGDFGAASKTLNVTLGATNTAVLICSSLTVVLAVWAAQTGRRKLLMGNLLATLVLGTAFLGIKGIEYKEKFERHHVPGAS